MTTATERRWRQKDRAEYAQRSRSTGGRPLLLPPARPGPSLVRPSHVDVDVDVISLSLSEYLFVIY